MLADNIWWQALILTVLQTRSCVAQLKIQARKLRPSNVVAVDALRLEVLSCGVKRQQH